MADLWGDLTDPYTSDPRQPGGPLGDALQWLYGNDQVQVPPQAWPWDLSKLTGMPSALEQSAAATAANPWQPGMTAGQVLAGRPDDPVAGSFVGGAIKGVKGKPLAAASDIPAPNIGQGSATPLFDLSRLAERPDVPQVDLPRAEPPARGIPQRVLDIGEPANMARVKEQVERGLPYGGAEWFNTLPLREGYQGEVGTEAGQRAYERFLTLIGPTSQQTRVPENIRNASYLNSLVQSGEGLPPPGSKLPFPYGMMDQTLENARGVLERGFPLSQPKTASFTQNLMGNYQPYTFDTHMARLYGLRNAKGELTDRPDPSHYSYLEGLGQGQATEMGLPPAAHQAGGWLAQEGLRSPREPFMATFEDRVRVTAEQRGETPQETLRKFYRGIPLLGLPAGLIGGGVPSND